MSLSTAILVLSITIIGISAVFLVHSKIRFACLAIVLCVITIFGVYCVNPSFRREINMEFDSTSYHRYTFSNNYGFELPLPQKTTLYYRSSDIQATYMTKQTADKILCFYENIADKSEFSKTYDGDSIQLLFSYQNNDIHITIKNDEKNRILIVGIAN